MELVEQFAREFSALIVQVLPFFLLGTLFAALLTTYVKPDAALKFLGSGPRAVINAALLGALLPGCSCATMPMSQALKSRGAGMGAVSSFMFISALLSPQTVILTYGMLGLKFTLARIIFSLIGAVSIGLLFQYLCQRNVKAFALAAEVSSHDSCCDNPSTCSPARSFVANLLQITRDLGKYFLLGMAVAALMVTLVPREAIPTYIGQSGPKAYLMAALMGIPVYICEGEEVPLTLALLKLGLGPGPAFTFLLGAVGTCIPTMIMAQKVVGRNPTLFYILFWIVFAVGSGMLFAHL